MITFSGQNYGVLLALRELGYTVIQRNGENIGKPIGNDAAIQGIIDNWTLADQQAHVVAEIDKKAVAVRNEYMAQHSPFEAAMWALKEQEARAVLAADPGVTVSAPNLEREATARGLSTPALAAKVIAKADIYLALDSAIWARRQQLVDATAAAVDFASCNEIERTIPTGWP